MNNIDIKINNIQKAIKGQKLPLQNEKQLQQKLEVLFQENNLDFKREKRLDNSNIIDFMFNGLGVELKIRTKASAMSVYRQIERYCSFDEIEGILLLTAKSTSLPSEINGKPVYVISLSRIAL